MRTSPQMITFVCMRHSAAATCLAFVNAHVGRCLAVFCSVMALKWACRYKSPAMEVSSMLSAGLLQVTWFDSIFESNDSGNFK